MRFRSLLFVPADRPERFAKAAGSGADAIILDLEDSVAPARKQAAREAVKDYLAQPRDILALVRVNSLESQEIAADVATILPAPPDAVMLPKANGVGCLARLAAMLGGVQVPVLPIATETPGAIFGLGSYRDAGGGLLALTWGAEDLPAAMGAATAREEDGSYTPPYQLARSLTLFAAHAAGVPAIETVYPDLRDIEGLAAYAARGRRDGFAGMMAIHPAQVAAINDAFQPSAGEVAHARAIIAAFHDAPAAGALQFEGRMIDRPHLVQARHLLRQAGVPVD